MLYEKFNIIRIRLTKETYYNKITKRSMLSIALKPQLVNVATRTLLTKNTCSTFLGSKSNIYLITRFYPGSLPSVASVGAGKGQTISGTKEAKVEVSNASPANINHPTVPVVKLPLNEILQEDKWAYTLYSPPYYGKSDFQRTPKGLGVYCL